MLNVLIMVHNQFSEILLRSAFSNKDLFNVIVVPWQTYSQSKESHIPTLEKVIIQNAISPDKFDYVIVETNYSVPASTNINEALLRYFLDNFKQTKIIGYSGTTESLIKALNFDPRIFVLPKDHTFASKISSATSISLTREEILPRIVKLGDLRKPGNEARRNSCPFRVELNKETQMDIENLARLRSNSMPQPVTPLFSMQAQSASMPLESSLPTSDVLPSEFKNTKYMPQ